MHEIPTWCGDVAEEESQETGCMSIHSHEGGLLNAYNRASDSDVKILLDILFVSMLHRNLALLSRLTLL